MTVKRADRLAKVSNIRFSFHHSLTEGRCGVLTRDYIAHAYSVFDTDRPVDC